MASTDARPIPRKNTAWRVTFPIFDADGDLVSGATGLDSEVSKDGGTFTDCTNEATEIATSSGVYYLDLTADEMNADTVAIIVKTSTSGAKTTPIIVYPEEAGDLRVDMVKINGDGANAGRLGSVLDYYDTNGYLPIGGTVSANVVQISGDSTAADNAEAFFDGTGYAGGTVKLDVNVEQINANSTAALNAEKVFIDERYLGVDVALISGDGTAAQNAEAFFDGTGYAGGTALLNVNVVQVSGDTEAADNLETAFEGAAYLDGALPASVEEAVVKLKAIGSAQIAYMSPQVGSTLITIYQGDSYYGTKTQKLRWAVPLNVADLTGATVTFKLAQSPSNFSKACSVTGAGVDGSQLVELQLTAAETAAWAAATGVKFEVEASWSGPTEVKTIDVGTATITAQLT